MNSDRPSVLLIACYELGHQPLSLAWPLAFLNRAGLDAALLDLAVESFDGRLAAGARFAAISVPMHTALRIGVEAARRLKQINPGLHICFFGLYAWLNRVYLLETIADTVLAGECEEDLVDLARAQLGGQPSSHTEKGGPALDRLAFPPPVRAPLPPIERYARYVPASSNVSDKADQQLSGYVEASRGCLHTCRHCPIVPIYQGRFFVVPAEVVIADVRQQVQSGARHITFGDPDFLNGPKHGLQIMRALHAEFPDLTYDFTAKVEHILKHSDLFPEFAALGVTYVVSAVESVSDDVLTYLRKGHSAADIDTALEILDRAGIAIQPTLVAFTPWTSLDDYLELLEWIRARGLTSHIPAIQLSIRLLIPPDSAVLEVGQASPWLGELRASDFTYSWSHPDVRMDELQRQLAVLVDEAAQNDEAPESTFERIRQAAYQAAGKLAPINALAGATRRASPRLTENWFCCAEPAQSQINFHGFVPDSDLRIL